MQIETGIYENYLGGLFFVEGIGSFFSPRKCDEPAVFLRSLSNQGRRCCTLVEHFDQERPRRDNLPVKRFELVRALPVEKMQILLPGTLVYLDGQDKNNSNSYLVKLVFLNDKEEIRVQLFNVRHSTSVSVGLDTFIQLYCKK